MFKPGHFIASSNVNISDDNVLEHAEVFDLTLSIPDELATMGIMLSERAFALATIYDNDGTSTYISVHSTHMRYACIYMHILTISQVSLIL